MQTRRLIMILLHVHISSRLTDFQIKQSNHISYNSSFFQSRDFKPSLIMLAEIPQLNSCVGVKCMINWLFDHIVSFKARVLTLTIHSIACDVALLKVLMNI